MKMVRRQLQWENAPTLREETVTTKAVSSSLESSLMFMNLSQQSNLLRLVTEEALTLWNHGFWGVWHQDEGVGFFSSSRLRLVPSEWLMGFLRIWPRWPRASPGRCHCPAVVVDDIRERGWCERVKRLCSSVSMSCVNVRTQDLPAECCVEMRWSVLLYSPVSSL